ncbi:hypothetical protein C8R44DRAFT_895408 [Mycena epipterygia]|nr:hypothetical protein C8R44DRAFT_895408 [Mycena epipterygia]
MPPDIRRRIFTKVRNRLAVLANSRKQDTNIDGLELAGLEESAEFNIALIPRSFTQIRSAAFSGDAAGTAMLFGILCFFASVQCLAISTQPRAVWIVSVVICSLSYYRCSPASWG